MNFAEVIGLLRKEIREFDCLGSIANLALIYSDLLIDLPVIELMRGNEGECYYCAIRPCGFELAPTRQLLDDRLAILGPALACYQLVWNGDTWYSVDRYSCSM